jgi:hypothetical protein
VFFFQLTFRFALFLFERLQRQNLATGHIEPVLVIVPVLLGDLGRHMLTRFFGFLGII